MRPSRAVIQLPAMVALTVGVILAGVAVAAAQNEPADSTGDLAPTPDTLHPPTAASDPLPAELTIVTVTGDSHASAIPGACFALYLDAGGRPGERITDEVCDGAGQDAADGMLLLPALPSGVPLLLVETLAPYAHAAPDAPLPLTLAPGPQTFAIANQPLPTGTLRLTSRRCPGDGGTSVAVVAPGETATPLPGCTPIAGAFRVVVAPWDEIVTVETDDAGVRQVDLPISRDDPHRVVVIASDETVAEASFAIAAGQTTEIVVTTFVEVDGEVLVRALRCVGGHGSVVVESGAPAVDPDSLVAADDGTGLGQDNCEPINALPFRIDLFGDTTAPAIEASTDDDANGDGTLLLTEIPATADAGPLHRFRTVAAGQEVETPFAVAAGALTTISVVVFAPADTATPAPLPATPAALRAVPPLTTGSAGRSRRRAGRRQARRAPA